MLVGEDHLGRSQEKEEEVIGNPIIEQQGKKFESPKFSFFRVCSGGKMVGAVFYQVDTFFLNA